MYISDIKETFLDFPDDESLSVIVFTKGCNFNCPECQNKELQKINESDKNFKLTEVAELIINYCKRAFTNKIVFSGGDPFYNSDELIKLLDYLDARGYEICVYTGNTIDKVIEMFNKYEENNNVFIHRPLYLKCGIYREDLRDPNMGKAEDKFVLASTNQSFYKWDGLRKIYYPISKGNILEFN